MEEEFCVVRYLESDMILKSSLFLLCGVSVTDWIRTFSYFNLGSGVLLQEGRTCVGREDAANEQEISKLVEVRTYLTNQITHPTNQPITSVQSNSNLLHNQPPNRTILSNNPLLSSPDSLSEYVDDNLATVPTIWDINTPAQNQEVRLI